MSVDPNASNAAQNAAQNGNRPAEAEDYPVVASPPSLQAQRSARRPTPTSATPSESVVGQVTHLSAAPSQAAVSLIILIATGIIILGLAINQFWLILAGSIVAIVLSVRLLVPTLKPFFLDFMSEQDRSVLIGAIGAIAAVAGGLKLLRVDRGLAQLYTQLNWDAIGALGEVFGALGQILIAVLAVYVAWRQYVISKDLTIQQNLITQQQTIDTYFQGVSDLVLDEDGLLEDWPQERAIAEGRTAAILSSVDGAGKAKIIRFLSSAKLLTPLRRDQRLGRAMLDGFGGYAEDRSHGVRVIDLGVMLAGADLSGTDLRWTDLSDANLIRATLRQCDLVKTNFARTILVNATLQGSDLTGTRFFYGNKEMASPRSRTERPNYKTGVHTGAVIEGVDFTEVQELSENQRYYCCAWCGSRSRATIPGGCDGIPNKLGR
ncbi:pentapeptide repeat-containing protein [Myxacorys almedinensis]|uniref:Pentapeptide repeat-containing protein n=1 Tax=Myxacorys almedinensis A TaxID=2690445 RepID=A0A8J8CHQ5_9CYAN|nr:pentapeptide repeat-containing protein [Myxacorys almedinensis]NDJ15711.1 pentapeptide repeat-containing protein [Myxacorys almedinensis A]